MPCGSNAPVKYGVILPYYQKVCKPTLASLVFSEMPKRSIYHMPIINTCHLIRNPPAVKEKNINALPHTGSNLRDLTKFRCIEPLYFNEVEVGIYLNKPVTRICVPMFNWVFY